MQECYYCKKTIKEEDTICPFCGYDHKAGTVSQQVTSVENTQKRSQIKEQKATSKGNGVDPRVKKFAFIGLGIVLFSILYKYNFNISIIAYEISDIFARVTGKKKDKTSEKIELIDVRSIKIPKKAIKYKGLEVEGVLFDPAGRSFVTINGDIIPEGGTSGNVTVQKIHKDSVELIVNGKSQIIEIKQ
jgi:hypothetical protein